MHEKHLSITYSQKKKNGKIANLVPIVVYVGSSGLGIMKKKGGEEGIMVFLDKTELMVLNSTFLPLKERMIQRPTWSGR